MRSEIDEDFAQLARFIFLRLIWDQQLQPWRNPKVLEEIPLAKQLINGGTDADKLWRLLATTASEAVWTTITLIDEGVRNSV